LAERLALEEKLRQEKELQAKLDRERQAAAEERKRLDRLENERREQARLDFSEKYALMTLITVNSFLFVGHLILCFFSWVGQSTNLRSQQNIYFSYIAYN